MKKIWTSITKPKEGAAGGRGQGMPDPGKVEEVERRLAQLRASGVVLSAPASQEAPRIASRRPGGPRRELVLSGPPGGATPPPIPADAPILELKASDRIDGEEPLVLTAEPEEPDADADRRFERASQPPVRVRRLRLGDVLVRRRQYNEAMPLLQHGQSVLETQGNPSLSWLTRARAALETARARGR